MSRGDFGANSTFASQPPSYGTLAGNDGNLAGRGRSPFSTISQKIVSALTEINKNIASLNRLSKQLGTSKDGTDLRVRLRDIQQSTNSIINESTRLVRESASNMESFEKAEKLRLDRLKSEFMTAVKSYSSAQTKIVDRERTTPLPSNLNSYPVGNGMEDAYMADEKQRLVEEENRRQRLNNLRMEQQVLDEETERIEERSRQIHAIEADIINVNEIFKDLAVIVQEQGVVIDTIEANVDRTSSNVVEANVQLRKASTYQKKARTKMCCIIGILLVVIAIVVVIVVVSVKK